MESLKRRVSSSPSPSPSAKKRSLSEEKNGDEKKGASSLTARVPRKSSKDLFSPSFKKGRKLPTLDQFLKLYNFTFVDVENFSWSCFKCGLSNFASFKECCEHEEACTVKRDIRYGSKVVNSSDVHKLPKQTFDLDHQWTCWKCGQTLDFIESAKHEESCTRQETLQDDLKRSSNDEKREDTESTIKEHRPFLPKDPNPNRKTSFDSNDKPKKARKASDKTLRKIDNDLKSLLSNLEFSKLDEVVNLSDSSTQAYQVSVRCLGCSNDFFTPNSITNCEQFGLRCWRIHLDKCTSSPGLKNAVVSFLSSDNSNVISSWLKDKQIIEVPGRIGIFQTVKDLKSQTPIQLVEQPSLSSKSTIDDTQRKSNEDTGKKQTSVPREKSDENQRKPKEDTVKKHDGLPKSKPLFEQANVSTREKSDDNQRKTKEDTVKKQTSVPREKSDDNQRKPKEDSVKKHDGLPKSKPLFPKINEPTDLTVKDRLDTILENKSKNHKERPKISSDLATTSAGMSKTKIIASMATEKVHDSNITKSPEIKKVALKFSNVGMPAASNLVQSAENPTLNSIATKSPEIKKVTFKGPSNLVKPAEIPTPNSTASKSPEIKKVALKFFSAGMPAVSNLVQPAENPTLNSIASKSPEIKKVTFKGPSNLVKPAEISTPISTATKSPEIKKVTLKGPSNLVKPAEIPTPNNTATKSPEIKKVTFSNVSKTPDKAKTAAPNSTNNASFDGSTLFQRNKSNESSATTIHNPIPTVPIASELRSTVVPAKNESSKTFPDLPKTNEHSTSYLKAIVASNNSKAKPTPGANLVKEHLVNKTLIKPNEIKITTPENYIYKNASITAALDNSTLLVTASSSTKKASSGSNLVKEHLANKVKAKVAKGVTTASHFKIPTVARTTTSPSGLKLKLSSSSNLTESSKLKSKKIKKAENSSKDVKLKSKSQIRKSDESINSKVNANQARLLPTSNSPLLLSCPDDAEKFSTLHCFARKNLAFFSCNKIEAKKITADFDLTIVPGQVGMRCVHCTLFLGGDERTRRTKGHIKSLITGCDSGAIIFPSQVSGIYDVVKQFIDSDHWEKNCKMTTVSQNEYQSMKEEDKGEEDVVRRLYTESPNSGRFEDLSPNGNGIHASIVIDMSKLITLVYGMFPSNSGMMIDALTNEAFTSVIRLLVAGDEFCLSIFTEKLQSAVYYGSTHEKYYLPIEVYPPIITNPAEILDALAEFARAGIVWFDIVENESFIEFVKTVSPYYKLPSMIELIAHW